MASWISDKQVKQWLEATRMPTVTVDKVLEETYQAKVRSALHTRYFVDTWLDEDSVPILIQSICSMYNAGIQYQRQFGEDIAGYAGQENWGQRLVSMADNLLADLASGATELDDSTVLLLDSGKIHFYPNDNTGAADPLFDTKFSMGMTF